MPRYRRRVRNRRQVKPGERGWICGFYGGTELAPLGIRGTSQPPSPVFQHSVVLLDYSEVRDHEYNLKVMRSIGELTFTGNGLLDDGFIVRAGIIVVQSHNNPEDGAEVVPYISPATSDDAEQSWLWLATIPVMASITTGANPYIQSTFAKVDFDTKTQRRMRQDDRLMLFMEAQYCFSGLGSPVDLEDLSTVVAYWNLNTRHFCSF